MLWQRKQGKNRDFVKEFSTGPSPFLGDYPTFPSGAVTKSLVSFLFYYAAGLPFIFTYSTDDYVLFLGGCPTGVLFM